MVAHSLIFVHTRQVIGQDQAFTSSELWSKVIGQTLSVCGPNAKRLSIQGMNPSDQGAQLCFNELCMWSALRAPHFPSHTMHRIISATRRNAATRCLVRGRHRFLSLLAYMLMRVPFHRRVALRSPLWFVKLSSPRNIHSHWLGSPRGFLVSDHFFFSSTNISHNRTELKARSDGLGPHLTYIPRSAQCTMGHLRRGEGGPPTPSPPKASWGLSLIGPFPPT